MTHSHSTILCHFCFRASKRKRPISGKTGKEKLIPVCDYHAMEPTTLTIRSHYNDTKLGKGGT